MKGLSLGALLGAVLMFVWGFLYWGVLPVTDSVIKTAPYGEGFQKMMRGALDETGVYYSPYSSDPTDADFQAQHKEGPIAMVFFRKEGAEPMAGSTMFMGWLHEAVALFIMGLMLKVASIGSFGGRVTAVFLGGLAGSVLAQGAGPIWWYHPPEFAIVSLIFEAIAWLLGGLVLAYFVAPEQRRDSNEV